MTTLRLIREKYTTHRVQGPFIIIQAMMKVTYRISVDVANANAAELGFLVLQWVELIWGGALQVTIHDVNIIIKGRVRLRKMR